MKKKIAILLTALALTIPCTSAFAGTWEKSTISWKYKQDNGAYIRGTGWHLIDGDWYYFSGGNIKTSYTVREETSSGAARYDLPAYYVGKDGKMIKGGFYQAANNNKIFADTTGKIITGFFMVDGVLYNVTNEQGIFPSVTTTHYDDNVRTKFMGNDGKEHTLHYIYDGGKVLELDGNPIKSDDKFYQLIKYLPKYDSKGNFLGAIQN